MAARSVLRNVSRIVGARFAPCRRNCTMGSNADMYGVAGLDGNRGPGILGAARRSSNPRRARNRSPVGQERWTQRSAAPHEYAGRALLAACRRATPSRRASAQPEANHRWSFNHRPMARDAPLPGSFCPAGPWSAPPLVVRARPPEESGRVLVQGSGPGLVRPPSTPILAAGRAQLRQLRAKRVEVHGHLLVEMLRQHVGHRFSYWSGFVESSICAIVSVGETS